MVSQGLRVDNANRAEADDDSGFVNLAPGSVR